MTFSLECRACGHSNRVDSSLVGKRVKCRGCGVALAVSDPRKSSDAPSGSAARLKFSCPACGKAFATKPELAGKKVRCSGCQKVVLVPAPAIPPTERAPQRPVRTDGQSAKADASPRPATQRDRGRNADRATPAPVLPKPDESDPEAYALRGDLAAMVQTGAEEHVESMLPPRAQLMEHVRRRAAAEAGEDPALARALASAKKRKGKTKRNAFFDLKDTLRLLGGILGVVLVVSFVAWRFPYFRWPFGLILLVLGFVTYFMGIVSLQELIADKSALILVIYRIFPPFQWLIIVSRWAEAKDFAPFFVVGAIIMGLGSGFIGTAPGGRRVDKPAKTVRRKGQPVAQPKALPTATASEEQQKPAASTPKGAVPPPASTSKEQAKPTGPAPASAKEQAKPTGPAPASPAPASATAPVPAPLSAPAKAQPKPQTQPLSPPSKPAGGR